MNGSLSSPATFAPPRDRLIARTTHKNNASYRDLMAASRALTASFTASRLVKTSPLVTGTTLTVSMSSRACSLTPRRDAVVDNACDAREKNEDVVKEQSKGPRKRHFLHRNYLLLHQQKKNSNVTRPPYLPASSLLPPRRFAHLYKYHKKEK